MLGLPRLARSFGRNPLALPAGRKAGFDPSHPAARKNLFSVAFGPNGPTRLDKAAPLTITGAPTPVFDKNVGHAYFFSGASDSVTITGPVVTDFTIGAVFRHPSAPNGTPPAIVEYLTTNNTGSPFGLQAGQASAAIAGPAFTLGTPYFVAVSRKAGSTANFVVVNLLTGVTTTLATSGAIATTARTTYAIGNQGRLAHVGNVYVGAATLSGNFVSMQDLLAWAQDPWAFWYPDPVSANPLRASATAYQLAADPTAFAFSGAPALFGWRRGILAAPASVAISGASATEVAKRKLPASPASVAFTGSAETPTLKRKLAASPASFADTGSAATPSARRKLPASAASFAFTGSAETPTLKRGLLAAPASFAGTSSAATPTVRRRLSAAPASFALTGSVSSLALITASIHTLLADPAVFAFTGLTATPSARRKLPAAPASVAFTGAAETPTLKRRLSAAPASFAETGSTATPSARRKLSSAPASFAFAGSPETPTVKRRLSAAPASFAATGRVSSLALIHALRADPAALSLSGIPATLAALRSGPQSWPIFPNWLVNAPARVLSVAASPRLLSVAAPARALELKALSMPFAGTFSPVTTVERLPLTIDFTNQLKAGDALSGTPTVTIAAHTGVDPSASGLLWGNPALSGNKVTQWAGPGWAPDVTYEITITASTAAGATISLYARITAQAE